MSTSFNFKKNWLFGYYELDYSLKISNNLSSSSFFKLAWQFLHAALPFEALAQKSLLDIKGRDKANIVNIDHRDVVVPLSDELFFTKGTYLKENEDIETDFNFSVNTEFENFVDSRHINNKVFFTHSQDFPAAILSPVYQDVQVNIEALRLGIDFFSSHAFAFFGFAPEVTQTLLIEADTHTFYLNLYFDKLKNIANLNLNNKIIDELNRIIMDFFKIDFKENFQASLDTNLSK